MGSAIIFGASGGIGATLADVLEADGAHTPVIRLSRGGGDFDLSDEDSIARCVAALHDIPPPSLIIIATGMLSEDERGPEKSWRALDPDWMARNFALNTIGPALIAKHVIPLLPRRERSVLAFLSARVGSISDNRLGGWHSYRASKAALNMMVRTLAVELARTHPELVCAALHPGTVDSALSRPFQSGVAAGKLFTPERSATALLSVLAGLTPAQSGRLWAWDGAEIAP